MDELRDGHIRLEPQHVTIRRVMVRYAWKHKRAKTFILSLERAGKLLRIGRTHDETGIPMVWELANGKA